MRSHVRSKYGGREIATTIPLVVQRLDGGSGTALVSNGIPLAPGVLPRNVLLERRVRIFVASIEQACYMEGLGQHPDGSCRALYLEFDPSLDLSVPRAGLLRIAQGVRVPSDLSRTKGSFLDVNNEPTSAVWADPRKAGFPTAVALPSQVADLIASGIVGPTLSSAATTGFGGQAAVWEARMPTYFDGWWDKNLPPAGFSPQTLALSEAHTGNSNYPLYGGNVNLTLTTRSDPGAGEVGAAPRYYNWRFATGFSSVTGHNYYDAALICFAWWVRTANLEHYKRGCAYAWLYNYYMRFTTNAGAVVPYFVQPHSVMPEGTGLHYLLTGDPDSKTGLQNAAALWVAVWQSTLGDKTSGSSEPRPMARILLTYLWAWKCGCTDRDYPALILDSLGKIVSGTARYPDGSWRSNALGCSDGSGGTTYYSNFMIAMLCDALVKVYEDWQADTRVPTTVKAALDFMYPGEWRSGDATPSFRQGYQDECTPSAWLQSIDLTNEYPHLWSWYWRYSGNTTYRDRSDTIFTNGVTTDVNLTFTAGSPGNIAGLKQLREHYCTSFRHVGYRY